MKTREEQLKMGIRAKLHPALASRMEISAIFVGEDSEPLTDSDISMYHAGDCYRSISIIVFTKRCIRRTRFVIVFTCNETYE
jgi:hypothetical protein